MELVNWYYYYYYYYAWSRAKNEWRKATSKNVGRSSTWEKKKRKNIWDRRELTICNGSIGKNGEEKLNFKDRNKGKIDNLHLYNNHYYSYHENRDVGRIIFYIETNLSNELLNVPFIFLIVIYYSYCVGGRKAEITAAAHGSCISCNALSTLSLRYFFVRK